MKIESEIRVKHVHFRFQGKHAEAFESTAIRTLPLAGLDQLPHSAVWSDMAPSSKGCILIYLQSLLMSDASSFQEPF